MVVVENLFRSETYGDTVYHYYYRLIKGKISLNYGGESIELQAYGIEVERQDIKDGVLVSIERDSIESISPERHKVHNLVKVLFDHSVSPIHLIDVIGEYAEEYITDFDEAVRNIATY